MDVGYMYIAFIWLLAVFLSNAINIHAGLNGLECGQSLVIAGGIIVLNVWSLLTDPTSNVVVGPHVFSLLLIAPFLCRHGEFVGAKLVPERGVCGRFVHVLRRDDFSRGWHFRPLLRNVAVVLFTASGEFFVLYSAIVQICAV